MNKHIKLIATDLDGTLLKNHHEITPLTEKTLKEAQKRGIKLVVATGRPYQTVKQYMIKHPYIDYFMINNGAAIYSNKDALAVIEHTFDGDTVKKILSFARTYTNDFEVHTKDAIYIHGSIRKKFFENAILREQDNPPNVCPLEDDTIFSHIKATKILLIEEDVSRYETLKQRVKAFGSFEIIQSQTSYIDINLKGISKGHALSELALSLNINMEDVMSFGDQENDLTMIKMSGFGVAMENAVDMLKKEASYITQSSDKEGVANAIQTFILS